MSLFKSAFSGIGSGAGVAWPLFGVVFTLVGASVGSHMSFVLGTIAIALFLVISIAVFYFSYQETMSKHQLLFEKLQKNQQKLLTKILTYQQSILKDDINHSASQTLGQILEIININKKRGSKFSTSQLINDITIQEGKKLEIPTSKLIISAFFGFIGTFGSVAGCSAGISGLLTGMGLFAGFATFPLLGWGIISLAIICGITIAFESASLSREDFRLNALNYKIDKMKHKLDKVTLIHKTVGTQVYLDESRPFEVEDRNLAKEKEEDITCTNFSINR